MLAKSKLGLGTFQNIDDIAMKLRQLMVEEWKKNFEVYAEKLPENVCIRFDKEMDKYCLPNEFSGKIGDLMAFGLANVLKTPLVLFSSIANFPLLTIHPLDGLNDSNVIIYLAFDNSNSGHYDAVIEKNTTAKQPPYCQSKPCSCGKNSKEDGRSYCDPKSKYGSHCPCLTLMNGCQNCKCKKCANPFGQKLETVQQINATNGE